MSQVTEDVLTEIKEKCEKVHNLLEEESKHDSESQPYKSKYAARELLYEMKSTLSSIKDSIRLNDPLFDDITAIYGAVLLLLGTVSIDTEEFATGEEHLMNCLRSIELKAIHPKNILTVLKVLNQLGLLWSQRSDNQKSFSYLQQAEQLYTDYSEQCEETPVDVYMLFAQPDSCSPQTRADSPLEKVHTLTLYYLAQVYGTLGNSLKSAVYCHTTLKRQLQTRNFDMIEWALNSATLAQFFMEQNAFQQARHHLAAASHLLDKYESEIPDHDSTEEEQEAKKERLKHRGADVARCWAKYGLVLLASSRERLMEEEDNPQAATTPQRLKPPGELSGLQFSQLELSVYEDQVTDSYVLTFEEARAVFLNAQQWLNQAKLFYTLNEHASDHVQVVEDLSELYRNLIFFEDDDDRQCKMHKRRVGLLDSVVKELNPNYYLTPCRELWFELGETYSAMLDIKLSKLQDSSTVPTAHGLQKVNQLAEQAIASYNQFLDSLKDHKTNELPETFSPELERPGLLIFFYLGRLYSKLVGVDKASKIANITTSMKYYQKVVDYCERNLSAKENVSAELSTCQDMVALLPLKLSRLLNN